MTQKHGPAGAGVNDIDQHGRHAGGHDEAHDHAPVAEGAINPVCAMTVDPSTAKHRAEFGGRTKFVANPERYLVPAQIAATPRIASGRALNHAKQWVNTGRRYRVNVQCRLTVSGLGRRRAHGRHKAQTKSMTELRS